VVVGVSEQHGLVEPGVGDVVAAGSGDAADEAVVAEAAQVVGHLPGGDVLGVVPRRGAISARELRERSGPDCTEPGFQCRSDG
jgi:hypothetical protein